MQKYFSGRLANLRTTFYSFPRTFRIILGTIFIDRLGGSMLYPFFAIYLTQRFGVSMIEVGWLFLIFAISGLAGSFLGGALTDRFGRRKMIIFSLLASSLANIGFGLVDSLSGFYIIGIVSGLFTSIGGPAQEAMVADILPEERRAEGFSVIRVVFNLAVVFGPVIGGYMATRSFLVLFLADAVISSISALIVYLNIPETKPAPKEHETPEPFGQTLRGYGIVFRDVMFLLFIAASFLSTLVYMNMNVTLGVFLLESYNITPDRYALLLSINAFMVVVMQFGITRRISKFPPMLTMTLGTAFYAIGFAMYGFVGTYSLFILAMVVITIGEMIVSPVAQALVASFAPEHMRGRYNAIFGMLVWGIPFAVGPLLAGNIMEKLGPNMLWYICGIIGTLSTLAYLALHRVHPATDLMQQPQENPSPA